MAPFNSFSSGHTAQVRLSRRPAWARKNMKVGSSASSSSASVSAAARTTPAPPPRPHVGNQPGPLDWARGDTENFVSSASSSSAYVPADTTGAAPLFPAAAPTVLNSVIMPEYGPRLEPHFGLSTPEATGFFGQEVVDPLPLGFPPVFPPFLASPRLEPVVRRPSHENTENFGFSATSSSASVPAAAHAPLAPPPRRRVSNLPDPFDWARGNTENFGSSATSSSASVPAAARAPPAPSPHRRVASLRGSFDLARKNMKKVGSSASSSSASVSAAARTTPAPPSRRHVGNQSGPLDWARGNTENFGSSVSSSSTSVPAVTRTRPAPHRRRVGNLPGPLDRARGNLENFVSSASSSSASVPPDTTGAASLALEFPTGAPTVLTSVMPEYGPRLEPLFGLSTPEAARFLDQEVVDPLPLVFPPFLAGPRLEPVVKLPSPEEASFFDRELPVPEIFASDAASAAEGPIVSSAANTTTIDPLPLAIPPYCFLL